MVLEKIANLGEGRKRKNLESISQLVLTYEPEFEDLSDPELFSKTAEFRQRVENGESLDDLLWRGAHRADFTAIAERLGKPELVSRVHRWAD